MTLRFLRASDLHIGRKFANIPQPADGNIRGRLMEARHGAIASLVSAQRNNYLARFVFYSDEAAVLRS